MSEFKSEKIASASSGTGLNSTPSANRLHISFFGRRNAGKSSAVNALTGQKVSIVSDVKGTTTDPVSKAMEILPIGPVSIIDTAGIDDEGEIGMARIDRSLRVLAKTDVAILVTDVTNRFSKYEENLIDQFKKRNTPFILLVNKTDLLQESDLSGNDGSVKDSFDKKAKALGCPAVYFSAVTGNGIDELKKAIIEVCGDRKEKYILGDVLTPNKLVILVTPIDESAPKGRLILPQVQTIRDILDSHCMCMTVQFEQLAYALSALKEPPFAVITDSQIFDKVKSVVPGDIYLTSFSILFARFKGILDTAAKGAFACENLKDGDKVLISEGCTHHRQCNDIGTVRLPAWIEGFSGKKLEFEFTSGGDFPDDLSRFCLIVHCGGCMLNEKEMEYRMNCAKLQGVPFTNYGIFIAHMNGILTRCLKIFES